MRHAIALTCLLAACGGAPASDLGPLLEGFTPPAMNGGEIAILSPIVTGIAPGADITLCSYLDRRFDVETDVTHHRVFQSPAGAHHVIVYAARQEQAPGTHECTEEDMLNARLVASGGAEGVSLDPPEGLTFRIPAGSQIMIQTHWINAGTKAIDGQAVAYLTAGPAVKTRQVLDLFNVFKLNFQIPPGRRDTVTTTCPIKRDLKLFSMTGHQHEWGTRVEIELLDGPSAQMLWANDWQPWFASNPPVNYYTADKPLVLKAGQQLKLTCTWNNTTDKDLMFPREMCVASGFYFPADGEIDCDDGVWSDPQR